MCFRLVRNDEYRLRAVFSYSPRTKGTVLLWLMPKFSEIADKIKSCHYLGGNNGLGLKPSHEASRMMYTLMWYYASQEEKTAHLETKKQLVETQEKLYIALKEINHLKLELEKKSFEHERTWESIKTRY